MKALTLTVIFGLIALACLLPFAHPSAQGVGFQVDGVYGSVIVYGLYYSDPWTGSSHAVYVSNRRQKSITYSYEWNHEVTDLQGNILADDTDWIAPPALRAGRARQHSSQRGVNLDAAGLLRGMRYNLRTYTSLNVDGINGEDFPPEYPDGWIESESMDNFLHPENN